MKFTHKSVSGHLKATHGMDPATYETNYMEAQDWAGEEEELPARREEPSTWRSQEAEEPGARRESSSHSFDSESLPGELVIAELEQLGAVQVGWMHCWE